MKIHDMIEGIGSFLGQYGIVGHDLTLVFILAVLLVVLLDALSGVRVEKRLCELEKLVEKLLAESSAEESTVTLSKKDRTVSSKKKTDDTKESSSNLYSGLRKTRQRFFGRLSEILSSHPALDEKIFEQLEELLISSDIGVKTTAGLLEQVREKVHSGDDVDVESIQKMLREALLSILSDTRNSKVIPQKIGKSPLVVLVVGVNGVGKTTTVGKLAHQFTQEGAKVLLGACDTFRAAAVEQIKAWGERVNVEVVCGLEGAKPATVAYEAIHKAVDDCYDVLIVDTAGRLHTRVNLMNELESVVQIMGRELPGSPHETLLVVDGSTGQNALQQARVFHDRAHLSGVIVTKLDGTPKGGIVAAIKEELDVPVRYIGIGESADDLKPFCAEDFVDALLDFDQNDIRVGAEIKVSDGTKEHTVRRRRRETGIQ